MARLTKREFLVLVTSIVLLAPLVVWGVLFLLGRFFDEPDDPVERALVPMKLQSSRDEPEFGGHRGPTERDAR
jgi:hypothetical protein